MRRAAAALAVCCGLAAAAAGAEIAPSPRPVAAAQAVPPEETGDRALALQAQRPPPAPRAEAPLAAPRPDAGPNKAAHAEAAARPPRPRRRVPPSCTADGAHCITPIAYTRDVCRTIEGVAREAGIDPHFFARLVWQESLFDAYAVSPAGALGIAQFMPETARLRGLSDPFNPAEALRASALYLAQLEAEFGNPGLAAVAYNGGEARAARFLDAGGDLPGETRHYVRKITGLSAQTWREDPPETLSVALAAERTFQAACVEKARGRGFRGPVPDTQWHMIYAAHPDRVIALRRSGSLVQMFPLLFEGSDGGVRETLLPGRKEPYYTASIMHDTESEARAHCARLRKAGGGCMVLRD